MTMSPTCRRAHLALPALWLATMGCFKLSREARPLQQYVLSGSAVPVAPAIIAEGGADSAQLTLGLRRIDLAAYLAIPSIVMRRGAHEVMVSEYHRWGEDLGDGINRVVALYLTAQRPVRSVQVAPWPARTRHDFIVQLHVSRFEGTAEAEATQGRVHVMTTWDIIRPSDGAVLVRGISNDSTGTFGVGDYTTLVSALDAALARVAGDIGTCLGVMQRDTVPLGGCRRANPTSR
jgi:uncharacterized lipoprotein YmbA